MPLMLRAIMLASCLTGSMRAGTSGDFDADGHVDLSDFAAFQPCFGPSAGGACLRAFDFNDDGDVQLDDYRLFRLRFAGPDTPPGMLLVPGGEFEMGDHHDGLLDALPTHVVYVDSFYMDIYEVTNQQYANTLNWALRQELIYVSDGVVYDTDGSTAYCNTTSGSSYTRITWDGGTFAVTAGKEDHPMLEVSWYGAAAYANWRSAQEGRNLCYNLSTWECDFDANGYRLATEAEWEYAARGGEHDPYSRYPWGDAIVGSNANYKASGDPYETGPHPWTTPAGYYDGNQTPPGVDMANGYGLYDMAGNVWEWCNDWFSSTYYGSSPYENPHGPATGTYRVFRGGSWNIYEPFLRCAVRNWGNPNYRISVGGSRLVLDFG